MDDRPIWERDLDALVRPSLVIDPPPDVQQSVLAAVLQATAQPVRPMATVAMPLPAQAPERPVSLGAYLLLAAVLIAYVATVSWLSGLVGDAGWIATLMAQLLAVSDLVIGRAAVGEPLTLVWLALQRVPWLALLPLVWLLWERDRASAHMA